MADNRLPLTILGGFLGAGKTTWLRHQLRHGLQAHVVVNEASGQPVDNALLSDAAGLTVLSGGCACCAGRAALITALRTLADRRSQGQAVADLMLETSGLADPAAILHAVATDPVLVHHIRPVGTVVLVDALHGFAGNIVAPLALAQMRAADRLILTKTDAVPDATVARLAATLQALNPLAEISAASSGAPAPLPAAGLPYDLTLTTAAPLTAITLPVPPDADWAALSLWLSGILHHHGDSILRVKGVVGSPAGRLLIQTVRQTVQPPEILPDGIGTTNVLAVIGSGGAPGALAASLARFLG